MRQKIENLVTIFQLLILYLSYYLFLLFKPVISKVKFIVGTDEIAKNIFYLGKVLDNSKTVCLRPNKHYDLNYDYKIIFKNKFLRFIYRIFYGPLILGYLANSSEIFFYIW